MSEIEAQKCKIMIYNIETRLCYIHDYMQHTIDKNISMIAVNTIYMYINRIKIKTQV